MEKTKILLLILVIIILGEGFIAWRFFQEKQLLIAENKKLQSDNAELNDQVADLRGKKEKAEKERDEIAQRLNAIKRELDNTQTQLSQLKERYDNVSREREELRKKLEEKEKMTISEARRPSISISPEATSTDYWADFVRTKAELEAKVDDLNKELLSAKTRIAELDSQNKNLSIKIDELTKEKERLEESVRFKESSISVMSRDLVREREARRKAIEELNKLRTENISLKREMTLVNKEKMELQNRMKELIEKKEDLESKISEIDVILKEKDIALSDMQERLLKAVKEGKTTTASETVSVELPPIVVRPEATATKRLKGEIIAVNKEERFVIIDLGESQGLRPGMQFKVMRGDRLIGNIEVIETRKDISAADIKEVVTGFAIQEGDIVISR